MVAAEALALAEGIANVVTGLATLGGLIFVWRQVRQAQKSLEQLEKNRIAELRPYVSTVLRSTTVRGEPAVTLEITNHGRTPALNVKISFLEGDVFHYVSNPNFPFLADDGISVLAPSETRTYFLGRLVQGTAFHSSMQNSVPIVVEYRSGVTEVALTQALTLSLNDGKYSVS